MTPDQIARELLRQGYRPCDVSPWLRTDGARPRQLVDGAVWQAMRELLNGESWSTPEKASELIPLG